MQSATAGPTPTKSYRTFLTGFILLLTVGIFYLRFTTFWADGVHAPYPARPHVVVVGIFKNEAENLPEWCNHYVRHQGIKHLYLIDNNSTDNWKDAIAPYKNKVTVVSRPKAHAQREHYDSFIPTLKKKHIDDWVFVLDTDEFLYASKPGETVASVVYNNEFFRTHTHLSVRWKMFGSSGFKTQPASILCSFTLRSDEDSKRDKILTKMGVAVKHLYKFGVHNHLYWSASLTRVINNWHDSYQPIKGEKELASHLLQLNHYPIQSFDWFKRIKMTRGSSSSTADDNVRDETYFKNYDHAERQDLGLFRQTDSCVDDSLFPRINLKPHEKNVVVLVIAGDSVNDFKHLVEQTLPYLNPQLRPDTHVVVLCHNASEQEAIKTITPYHFKEVTDSVGTIAFMRDIIPNIDEFSSHSRYALVLSAFASALQRQNATYNYWNKLLDAPKPNVTEIFPTEQPTFLTNDFVTDNFSKLEFTVPRELNTVFVIQLRDHITKTKIQSNFLNIFTGIPQSQIDIL